MKERLIAKEEIVNMLSDIYHQLEEVESKIDSSFSSIRQGMQDEYSDKIAVCSAQLNILDGKMSSYNHRETSLTREGAQRQPSIKLELMY